MNLPILHITDMKFLTPTNLLWPEEDEKICTNLVGAVWSSKKEIKQLEPS